MSNNLYKVENTLRSIAKRCKSVKYSLGLAIVAQETVVQQEVMTTE